MVVQSTEQLHHLVSLEETASLKVLLFSDNMLSALREMSDAVPLEFRNCPSDCILSNVIARSKSLAWLRLPTRKRPAVPDSTILSIQT
jgi:hypothetical protein